MSAGERSGSCYKTPAETDGTEASSKNGGLRLADCHVHLGFMSNAAQVAADAERDGLLVFANTVTPREYLTLCDEPWSRRGNVRLGVGLHPWWVARGWMLQTTSRGPDSADDGKPHIPRSYASAADVDLAAGLAERSRWVGEVGLDFSPKHTDPSTHEAQVAALRSVLEACGSHSGGAGATPVARVISLHAVASADTVLDLLEETGAGESCCCVFHWFSGSTAALWRAIRLGCWFSVNERQARTRRAKEQLKLIPTDRLLLETDFPPHEGEPFRAAAIEESLERTCALLACIRRAESDAIRELTTANARSLLHE